LIGANGKGADMSEVKRCENCGNEQIQILNYKGDYLCGICGRDTERMHEIEHDEEVRAKAIDEFAERLNKELHCAFSDDLEIQKYVDEIAEQLKGGAVDG